MAAAVLAMVGVLVAVAVVVVVVIGDGGGCGGDSSGDSLSSGDPPSPRCHQARVSRPGPCNIIPLTVRGCVPSSDCGRRYRRGHISDMFEPRPVTPPPRRRQPTRGRTISVRLQAARGFTSRVFRRSGGARVELIGWVRLGERGEG